MLNHERECFSDRLEGRNVSIDDMNVSDDSMKWSRLEEADMILIGGSGDYSMIEGGFAGYKELVEAMEYILDHQIPTFASCFGFQVLIATLGGELVRHPEMAELGTYEIALTEAGRNDPVLGSLPERFNAQLGHKDSVTKLPDSLTRLACSANCDVQAVRYREAPVIATQFHPELRAQDNIDRFYRYIESYKKQGETIEEAKERADDIHEKSPHVVTLLPRFVDRICR